VHTCRNLTFLGCPGEADGALREYLVIAEASCYPVSEAVSTDQAVLSEPLAIGLYSANQALPLKASSIGILGCGPIGLSVLLAARCQGAEKIYASDKLAPRRLAAAGAGAAWVGDPDSEDVTGEITQREPLLLDTVFECCGQQEALDQAVALLKPGGKLVLVGIPVESRIDFDIDALRRKEICIQNIRRQCDCTGPALEMIQKKALDPDFMVTHHFGLDQVSQAFDLVAGYEDGVIKAIINI
jgi:L-iditol 2-dehydrogenase